MNEAVFDFLRNEIAQTANDAQRLKYLRSIETYLIAAKKMRSSYEHRDIYSGEYAQLAAVADRFDLECAMAPL